MLPISSPCPWPENKQTNNFNKNLPPNLEWQFSCCTDIRQLRTQLGCPNSFEPKTKTTATTTTTTTTGPQRRNGSLPISSPSLMTFPKTEHIHTKTSHPPTHPCAKCRIKHSRPVSFSLQRRSKAQQSKASRIRVAAGRMKRRCEFIPNGAHRHHRLLHHHHHCD